jgi:hypothetical protein
MPSLEHTEHTTCGSPSCMSFHLFCPDCGARHHLGDQTGPIEVATESLTRPAELSEAS